MTPYIFLSLVRERTFVILVEENHIGSRYPGTVPINFFIDALDWQWMVILALTVWMYVSREASEKMLNVLVLPNRTQFLLIVPSLM